jgi:hypothetical protein
MGIGRMIERVGRWQGRALERKGPTGRPRQDLPRTGRQGMSGSVPLANAWTKCLLRRLLNR